MLTVPVTGKRLLEPCCQVLGNRDLRGRRKKAPVISLSSPAINYFFRERGRGRRIERERISRKRSKAENKGGMIDNLAMERKGENDIKRERKREKETKRERDWKGEKEREKEKKRDQNREM